MANNRLWLEDRKTGDRMLLAKSFGNGWLMYAEPERFQDFCNNRDIACSYCDQGPTTFRLVTETDDVSVTIDQEIG